MLIKSTYIYGYSEIVDRSFDFKEGLCRLNTDDPVAASSVFSFLKAVFCGFEEEPAVDGSGSADNTIQKQIASTDGNAASLPLRSLVKPADNIPFGGEVVFRDRDDEIIISAKWGDGPEEDVVSIKKQNGSAELLSQGECVAGKLWDLSSSEAALLLFMPSSSGETARMLRTLTEKTGKLAIFPDDSGSPAISSQPASGDNAPGSAESPAVSFLPANPGLTEAQYAHLEDLKAELAAVDLLEEKLAESGKKLRCAEKEKAGEKKDARKAGNIVADAIRAMSKKIDDCERAEAIRTDAAELMEEIVDEEKYVKKLHLPWQILLWLLTILSAAAIVLLTLFPTDIPGLGNFLTKIRPIRFQLLAGAGILFVGLIVLIAAVSGSGLRRLTLLKEELTFRKKELSELLFNDTTVTNDNEEFFDDADREMVKLKAASDEAKKELASAAEGKCTPEKSATQESSPDRIRAIEAERNAYMAALRLFDPYPVIAKKCENLEYSIKNAPFLQVREQQDDLNAGDTVTFHSLSAEIEARAKEILLQLTFGKQGGLKLSEEMVPYIDDNGTARGLGSFNSETVSQVILSVRLAMLSVTSELAAQSAGLGSDIAGCPTGILLLDNSAERFNMSPGSPVVDVINGAVNSAKGEIQLICP